MSPVSFTRDADGNMHLRFSDAFVESGEWHLAGLVCQSILAEADSLYRDIAYHAQLPERRAALRVIGMDDRKLLTPVPRGSILWDDVADMFDVD